MQAGSLKFFFLFSLFLLTWDSCYTSNCFQQRKELKNVVAYLPLPLAWWGQAHLSMSDFGLNSNLKYLRQYILYIPFKFRILSWLWNCQYSGPYLALVSNTRAFHHPIVGRCYPNDYYNLASLVPSTQIEEQNHHSLITYYPSQVARA